MIVIAIKDLKKQKQLIQNKKRQMTPYIVLLYILPEDITNHIIMFAKLNSAEIIKQYFKKTLAYKIKHIHNSIEHACFQCNLDLRMTNYGILYKNTILTRESVIQTLSSCHCCARHQINKPKTLNSYNFQIATNTHYNNQECTCPCRHMSRFICQQATD